MIPACCQCCNAKDKFKSLNLSLIPPTWWQKRDVTKKNVHFVDVSNRPLKKMHVSPLSQQLSHDEACCWELGLQLQGIPVVIGDEVLFFWSWSSNPMLTKSYSILSRNGSSFSSCKQIGFKLKIEYSPRVVVSSSNQSSSSKGTNQWQGLNVVTAEMEFFSFSIKSIHISIFQDILSYVRMM